MEPGYVYMETGEGRISARVDIGSGNGKEIKNFNPE